MTQVEHYKGSHDLSDTFFLGLQRSSSAYRSPPEDCDDRSVLLTEVLHPKDIRCASPEMNDAVR